ncbi:hypothetical protein APUTEX25_000997, partial [Auxenochlorella protothecoides]
ELNETRVRLERALAAADDFHARFLQERAERRKVHEELQSLRGNIRTLRVRCGDRRTQEFEFGTVADAGVSQAELFEEVAPLVRSVADGHNVCIFAYGQTGSGKTHTVTGPAHDPGLAARAADALCALASAEGAERRALEVGMLEVYGDVVRDLLAGPDGAAGAALEVSGLGPGQVADCRARVPGLGWRPVAGREDVLALLREGCAARATAGTALNAASSRSHAVLSIRASDPDGLAGASVLHLVDLAGSERVARSEVTGQQLREAQAINKSLSALGDVMAALATRAPHVLQDSLCGSSKVLLVCCLDPDPASAPESLSSLAFAARAARLALPTMEPVRTPAANYSMVSVAEAVETALGATRPLPPQDFSYIDALGLTLAEDVLARDPIPAYRASIKDGYAVRAVDGPGVYPVAFEAFAGAEPETLPPGTVAYIGTGGPLPEGADAVVQIEDTLDQGADDRGQRLVKILVEVPGPGYDVRQIGSDVAQGEVILPAGHHLLPAEIGILAGSGAVTVKAYPRPRVAVLSTGDEVKDPAAVALGPGQVRDTNRAMLMAAVSEAGALTQDLGIAGDTEEESTAAFRRALDGGADVMLITGGVSMGQRDYIKPLLEAQGTVHFGKVCMKPGKPLTFAEVPREGRAPLLVFGLPGNPVSGLVTFNLVVLPCLRRLQGWGDPGLRRVHARLSFDIKQDPARPEYHRAIGSWRRMAGGDGWELVAQSTGGQISSRLLSLRAANLLLEIPR